MSTRACYTFKDANEAFHVYTHWHGEPIVAERCIQNAVPKAWELPRFEACEFGAAFIAGNKKQGGTCLLMPSGEIMDIAPENIDFRYEIEAVQGVLHVAIYQTAYSKRTEKCLWVGPLSKMRAWAKC